MSNTLDTVASTQLFGLNDDVYGFAMSETHYLVAMSDQKRKCGSVELGSTKCPLNSNITRFQSNGYGVYKLWQRADHGDKRRHCSHLVLKF